MRDENGEEAFHVYIDLGTESIQTFATIKVYSFILPKPLIIPKNLLFLIRNILF